MPEGDTAWRTARALDTALSGARLTLSDFRVPELAEVDLTGHLVEQTLSRGKHLLTRIDNGVTVHSHLKMEGAWHLYRAETRWRRPVHEVRLVLGTPRWLAVGFALGVLEVVPTAGEDAVVGHLGPDLLGDDWEPDEAVRRLSLDPERSIGSALLDQRNLAGIGNVYVNELCFVAGIRPQARVGDVRTLPHLVARAHAMLLANRDRGQRTTTGDTRHGMQLWVYGRSEQPCRRCGTRLESGRIGEDSRQRSVWWCPSCQPDLD